MNKVVLMGRLTRDPDIRYTQSQNPLAIARYTLAVDRRYNRDGDQKADFPSCVVFGKGAEFAEKYLHKGTKVVVTGRLQTGSYTRDDGVKVYTTEVIVEEQEFAESKAASNRSQENGQQNGGQQYSNDRGGYGGSGYDDYTSPEGGGFSELEEADGDLPF